MPLGSSSGAYTLTLGFEGDIGAETPCITALGASVTETVALTPIALAPLPPHRRPKPPRPDAQATVSVPAGPKTATPRIRVTSGASAGQAFGLHPGEQIIGREEGSEIRLEDSTVSHNHAVLRVHGEQVTIEDLRSTNGTKVNGVIIERQTSLTPADQIDVGGVTLILE